ncbi:hypothetical protein RGC78_15960 [Clostridium sp. 5N-1]|uniref:Uncharacterized protein n=1 Tax=Clostridium aquiflavi TaxID=3073603 RepID=A0ABU1EL18_9CLOT|nr:hypothetical protein [Clostridium sp. 5N-1]
MNKQKKDGNNIFEYNTLNQAVKAITKEGNTLVSRYAHIKMVRKQPPKSFLYRRFKN